VVLLAFNVLRDQRTLTHQLAPYVHQGNFQSVSANRVPFALPTHSRHDREWKSVKFVQKIPYLVSERLSALVSELNLAQLVILIFAGRAWRARHSEQIVLRPMRHVLFRPWRQYPGIGGLLFHLASTAVRPPLQFL
jgi:hypothetical protein